MENPLCSLSVPRAWPAHALCGTCFEAGQLDSSAMLQRVRVAPSPSCRESLSQSQQRRLIGWFQLRLNSLCHLLAQRSIPAQKC
eukprot:1649492-Amphidinium_carterae.1